MLTDLNVEASIVTQPVATLTNGSHHIKDAHWGSLVKGERHNFVKSFVHGRSWQIVHGGIDDAKVFLLTRLQVLHFRDANTRIAHQGASRLGNDLALPVASLVQNFEELTPHVLGAWGMFCFVLNA